MSLPAPLSPSHPFYSSPPSRPRSQRHSAVTSRRRHRHQQRGMAPPSRPLASRSNSSQQQQQQRRQQQQTSPTSAAASGSGSGSGSSQGNELLFLTYSNPTDFQNDRTNRRIVKRWASTTGLKNIRSQESSQDESRGSSRPGSTKDPSPSASRRRPSRQTSASSATASDTGSIDPRIVAASPAPLDADPQRDAQSLAYYRENYKPRPGFALPQRPARPTAAQADQIRSILGFQAPGSAWSDPFDDSDYPVEESEYVGELILYYLRGDVLSEAWLGGEYEGVKARLLPMRAQFWFPFMLQSRAAYCAMLAFVESTPGIQKLGKTGELIQQHTNLALRACTAELTDANRLSSNPTVLAVILLMVTAQRMGDLKATRTHARGLALLQGRRHDTRMPKQANWAWDCVWDMSPDAVAMRGGPPAGMVPTLSDSPRSSTTRALEGPVETQGFDTLAASQRFGPAVSYFFHLSLVLVGLSTMAGQDAFAGTAVVQHCMLESLEALPQLNATETAAFQAVRLAQHACVRPVRSADDIATNTCVERAYQGLCQGGLDSLRKANRADAILWIAVAVGSYACAAERRAWFGGLMQEARQRLGYCDVEAAITTMDEEFIWARAMNGPVRAFWAEFCEEQ